MARFEVLVFAKQDKEPGKGYIVKYPSYTPHGKRRTDQNSCSQISPIANRLNSKIELPVVGFSLVLPVGLCSRTSATWYTTCWRSLAVISYSVATTL